jgi:hypothetical protein
MTYGSKTVFGEGAGSGRSSIFSLIAAAESADYL